MKSFQNNPLWQDKLLAIRILKERRARSIHEQEYRIVRDWPSFPQITDGILKNMP